MHSYSRKAQFNMIRLSKLSVIICLLIAPLFSFLSYAGSAKDSPYVELLFPQSGISVRAEIADSPEKRAQGLMFRSSLGDKEAMIFIFDKAAYQEFWMFRTLIPLTIIFLDNHKKIVDIQDMQPCRELNPDLCMVYRSHFPAKYAIETNQGFNRKFGIKTGQKVIKGEHK